MFFNKYIKILTFIFCTVFTTATFNAPVYSQSPFVDRLSICLVESVTEEEKIDLVRWITLAFITHPSLSDFKSLFDDSKIDEIHKKMADSFVKLLAEKCQKEFVSVIEYSEDTGLGKAFELLGKIAATSVLSHSDVEKELERFIEYIDLDVLGEMFEEN